MPKIGDPIPGTNLMYEAEDIANLGGIPSISAEQQVSTIRGQIDTIRKQIEALGQGTGTLSLTGGTTPLALNEMKVEPPVTPPDVSGTKSLAESIKEGVPTNELLVAEIQKRQKELETKGAGLKGLLEEKPKPINVEEITGQAFQALGLPADFTKQQFTALQTSATEIKSLNEQLGVLEKQEQQSLINIQQQAIPMENISTQQKAVMRDYAIQKSGIAASIQAKAAYAQALQGNFTLANQAIDKTVQLATYKKTQEIADYKWMIDNYKDEFNSLTKREQSLYDDLIKNLQKETELTQTNLKDKLKMYLDAKVPIPDLATVQGQSFGEAAEYVSQNRPSDVSVVDVRAQEEAFRGELVAVQQLGSRQASLDYLNQNLTFLRSAMGEDNLKKLFDEVNRLYPEVVEIPKPVLTPKERGEATRRVTTEVGRTARFIPEAIGEQLKSDISAVKGFFGGLFGK